MRGLNVPIGRQGGRVFRRVAGRDAVQQAVIEETELAKASDVVALDACLGQRLDLGVDAVHLGSGERRASQGAQVIEQGTSVALELAAEDVPHRQVGDVLEDHSAKAHLPGVERRGGADVLGGVHRVRDVVGYHWDVVRVEGRITKATFAMHTMEGSDDNVVGHRVLRRVRWSRVVPVVVRAWKRSVELGCLSRKEDDGLVAVG